MSKCISRDGEYSDHTLDADWTCTRCSVLDLDPLIDERNRLRARVAELESTRPTGDVIEQARVAVKADHDFSHASLAGAGGLHLLDLTLRVLADAGLLATPVQQDVVERGRQLASERDDLIAAGADPTELAVPLAPRVFVDGREVVGEMAVTEAQEWLSIPIPPDAETLGRIRYAISDPGAFVKRSLGQSAGAPYEGLSAWQTRAVLRALSGEVGSDGR